MSDNSSIEWTDTTWNPVTGCTKVSPGCAHCYAETFAERFRGVPGHPFEQGFDLKLWPERLALPLSWKKPRRIFVNSMSDLFHEGVPFEFIDRVFAVMALASQHTFQVLTKRPERMREYFSDEVVWARIEVQARKLHQGGCRACQQADWDYKPRPHLNGKVLIGPFPHVWLGTSTENQHWLDIRVPELLATPAAVRFLSCEPLLGPLDLTRIDLSTLPPHPHNPIVDLNALTGLVSGMDEYTFGNHGIDWVIVGGESGPKARSMDVGWERSIVEQCRAAGVACFVKQLGAKPYSATQRVAGGGVYPSARAARTYHDEPVLMKLKSRKGGDPDEWPEDLRVREMPR